MNRGSTRRFVPPPVSIGFSLFVLAKKRLRQFLTVRWSARGAIGFRSNRNVGILFCPASHRPAVRPAPCRHDQAVVCPGFGLDRFGNVHHFMKKILEGETITNTTFDMKNYFKVVTDQHLSIATKKLNLSGPKPRHTTGRLGRHGPGRKAVRGDAGQNKVPTFRWPCKPTAPLALKRTEKNCPEQFFASTN